MRTNRRCFLGALLAVPVIGPMLAKLSPAPPFPPDWLPPVVFPGPYLWSIELLKLSEQEAQTYAGLTRTTYPQIKGGA